MSAGQAGEEDQLLVEEPGEQECECASDCFGELEAKLDREPK